jgi:hypothetical protein
MGAFGVVVIVVSIVAALVAFLSYLRADRLYRAIGRVGTVWLAAEEGDDAERELVREEMRQLLAGVPGRHSAQRRPTSRAGP